MWPVIVGWVVWTIGALVVAGYVLGIRGSANKGEQIHLLVVFQLTTIAATLISFLFFHLSKLHLFWALPAAWAVGFLGFAIFPLPVFGTVLRLLTLGVANLVLIGKTAHLRGPPSSR